MRKIAFTARSSRPIRASSALIPRASASAPQSISATVTDPTGATYVFAGLCAGLAGLVATSNIKSADANHIGLYLELDAILAVVVGGTALTGGRFQLAGSLIGALLIQTLNTTLYARNVSADIAPVPKAVVILAVCLLQSPVLRAKLSKLSAFLPAKKGGAA